MRLYFSRPEQVAVAALVLVILAALVTLTVVHGRRAAAEGPFLQHTAFTTLPRPDAELVVHVAGAVAHPGVYHLPVRARVGDAVQAAGGATADADPDALNLAAPAEDGGKIDVPLRHAAAPTPAPTSTTPDTRAASGSHASRAPKPLPTAPIALNTATSAELQSLPGVGEKTAARILDYRHAHGPFHALEELLNVERIAKFSGHQHRSG